MSAQGSLSWRKNGCVQLWWLLPWLLCPLLSASGCAFQSYNSLCSDSAHSWTVFFSCRSGHSCCTFKPSNFKTKHNTQALLFILYVKFFFPVLLCYMKRVSVQPSLSMAQACMLWLFLESCDSQHPLFIMLPAPSLNTSHAPVIWHPCVGCRHSDNHTCPFKVVINCQALYIFLCPIKYIAL